MLEIEIIDDRGIKSTINFSSGQVKSICRICFNKNACINIYEASFKGTLLSEMFKSLFLKLNRSENLPKYICKRCNLSFMKFCAFEEQILQSQELLQIALRGVKEDEFTNECEEAHNNSVYENEVPDSLDKKYESDDSELLIENNSVDSDGTEYRDEMEDIFDINYEDVYICKYCETVFYDVLEYNSHLTREKMMREKTVVCDVCNRQVLPHKLKKHLEIHSIAKPYSCDICGKKFSLKGILNKHKLSHLKTKVHKCHICEKSFLQRPTFKEHLMTHHRGDPLISQYCGKKFKNSATLKKHVSLHKVDPNFECREKRKKGPFFCDFCEKKFPTNQGLEIHTRTHTGERPFACDVCGKRFTQFPHLTGHMRLHTGEKPYTCDYCLKKFTLKTNLQQHIKVHTGDKPHTCVVCLKGFYTSSALKKHKLVHERDKYN